MTPLQQLLAFLLPLLCSLYVLVSAVRACWPRRRAWNRRRPGVLGAPASECRRFPPFTPEVQGRRYG